MQAYEACGGPPNKGGFIDRKVLEDIVQQEFQMTIDIKKMLDDVDTNQNGEIEYDEFKSILEAKHKKKQKS